MDAFLSLIHSGKSLNRSEAQNLIERMIVLASQDAQAHEQIESVLLALREKNETGDELQGFVDGLIRIAHLLGPSPTETLIDVCGTGGDRSGTFNVSTASALILSSGGIQVAKHGNRGVSSKSGSADVLDVLKLKSDTTPEGAQESLKKYNLSFMFAPAFHPVLAKLAPIRKKLGVYTIFNALGPLLNPAPLTHQMVGVYHSSLLEKAAQVLKQKGLKEAFVVHGSDGLDELTLTGESTVAHLKNGEVKMLTLKPEDFGIQPAPLLEVQGGNSEINAEIIQNILKNVRSPKRDLVVMNAAAAVVLLGREKTFKEAAQWISHLIDSGKAQDHYERMRNRS